MPCRVAAGTPASRGIIIWIMDREAAWDVIHARLPAGWRVGPVTYDPAARRFEVVAIAAKVGGRRGGPPATIIGMGEDELEALRDLGERLNVREEQRGGDARRDGYRRS